MRPYRDTRSYTPMKLLRAQWTRISQDFPFKVRDKFFHLVPSTKEETQVLEAVNSTS